MRVKAKQSLLLIVLLFLSNLSVSQDKKSDHSYILKLNTTALIDGFSFPTVQLALERKFNNSFSLQGEFGIQLYDLVNSADTISLKSRGFRAIAESRFYFLNYYKKDKSKKRVSDGVYAGIQIFYRENQFSRNTNYYYENNADETSLKDNFGVKKKIFGANLALGFQKEFGRFVLEPYSYIGIMHRDIENYDRSYDPELHFQDNGHNLFGDADMRESSGYEPNFSIGLRIGYRL